MSILSILAGISIPAIGKWVKLNKISEAKALASAAALECLQFVRVGKDPSTQDISELIISNDRLKPTGYQIDSDKTKCNEFNISPIDKDDTVLYSLGFRISIDGKISKLATPALDQLSLNSCKQWAGINCGISAEQQAEWDRLAKIEKAKSSCNENFYDWLKNTKPDGGTGSKSRWDSTSNSCSNKCWAFEGSIQGCGKEGQKAYKEAEKRKYGKICAEKISLEKEKQTNGGPITITECGTRKFYFCTGEDKSTLEEMNKCQREKAAEICKSNQNSEREGGHEGKYGPFEGPDPCGEVKWMCNKKAVDTEEKYFDTPCGKKPEPDPYASCSNPADFHWVCQSNPTHPKCTRGGKKYIPC